LGRVKGVCKNTTLGETLRQYVAPWALALSENRRIIYYMDTTHSNKMKTSRSHDAVIALLKKQLQTERKEIVRNSFFKIFNNLNNKLKQQLWIEAQL
jgi:hypothetical protein